MFYTFHLWEISVSPVSVSLSEYQEALISYPYNLYRMPVFWDTLCFSHLRDPLALYLFIWRAAHPPQTSLSPTMPWPWDLCVEFSPHLSVGLVLSLYPFIFSHSWSWYCLLINYISVILRHAHNLSLMKSSPKIKIVSFQTCVFFFHDATGDVSESERMDGWTPCSNWKWRHLDQQIILGNKPQIQAFIYRSQETNSGRFDNKLSN